MQRRSKQQKERPSRVLFRLGRWYSPGSIGQTEALAGINIQSQRERTELWNRFSHLFAGDSQTLIDAVMDHCAAIALERIKRGELCLVPSFNPGACPR